MKKSLRKNVYTVAYRMFASDLEKHIDVLAVNKADAYDIATYNDIPTREGGHPYSAWVYAVTYQNGKERRFNTDDGNPY